MAAADEGGPGALRGTRSAAGVMLDKASGTVYMIGVRESAILNSMKKTTKKEYNTKNAVADTYERIPTCCGRRVGAACFPPNFHP